MNDDLHIDFERLFVYEGIPIAKQGDRHYRQGWLSTPCPFCTGDEGNHLGYNAKYNVFTCWRCGKHTKGEVLATLLNKPKKEAVNYAKEFYGLDPFEEKPEPEIIKADTLIIPGSKEIPPLHREYLTKRWYNPDKLASQWDLYFTTYHETHPWRIIAPVWHDGKYVSYVGRDASGVSPTRYLTCFPRNEIRDCKLCVFGMQYAVGKTVIVVEGMFDAFRIGYGAIATLGTGWKQEQAEIIARNYDTSYILYDPEHEAQKRATRLAQTLSMMGKHKSHVIELKGTSAEDPGDLNDEEVGEIRKLLKGSL